MKRLVENGEKKCEISMVLDTCGNYVCNGGNIPRAKLKKKEKKQQRIKNFAVLLYIK